MVKTLKVFCIVLAGLGMFTGSAGAKEEKEAGERKGRKKGEWQLCVQAYTFNRFTFFEAVDKAKSLGLKNIEGFSWQKISSETGDAQLNPKASPEVLKKVREKLESSKIKLVNYYFHELGKDEGETRDLFNFAKRMGIRTFVSEPKAEHLPLLDKLAKEYGINVAIHNHPRDEKKPDYKNWDPAEVMKMIEPYSKRIGCCADTGHWVRSGLNPVECIKKYEGRLICLHFKDVNEMGPAGHDVPWGTGVGNAKGQFDELKRQRFSGVITIEYEHNMENNVPDLAKCIEFYKHQTGKK